METHEVVLQDPVQELKAERVQEEVAAAPAAEPLLIEPQEPLNVVPEEPFRISLKAERVQEPSSLLSSAGGTVSLAYELSFNQMRAVTVHLEEPQIVISLFATGGLAAT